MNEPAILNGLSLPPAEGGRAQQLVVLLHGVGAVGENLIDLGRAWAPLLPGAEFVALNAPFPYDMVPPGYDVGYQWFSLQDRSYSALLAGVRQCAPILNRTLDRMLADRGLEDDKLVLVGFSQGAMIALHVGLRRKKCAGILGFSGCLIEDKLEKDREHVWPEILLVHGDIDEVVSLGALQSAKAFLESYHISVKTHICQGLGHSISPEGVSLGGQFMVDIFNSATP